MKFRMLNFFCCGALIITNVYADVPIKIVGVISTPSCIITGADGTSAIDVNFGGVNLSDVGTSRTMRTLNIEVQCDNTIPINKILEMKVIPSPSGIPLAKTGAGNILPSSLTNLGIELTTPGITGSIPLILNQWIPIQMTKNTGMVTLNAGLVSSSLTELQAGSFTASASVLISYQ